ncbi:MAG: AMP-binding protein, partial [Promethearchaeota archaeon]
MININSPEDWQWIGDWLGRRAALTPDHEALLDPSTEQRYSYAELNDRGNQLAHLLSNKYNIKKGDSVAFLLHNRIECIDAFAACGKLGAILVPLNVRLTLVEHQEYLANIQPTVLIYEGAFDKTVNEFRHNVPSLKHFLAVDNTSLKNIQSYGLLLSKQPTTSPPRPSLGFEDPFFILPTGGTTGLPKGAVLSHR